MRSRWRAVPVALDNPGAIITVSDLVYTVFLQHCHDEIKFQDALVVVKIRAEIASLNYSAFGGYIGGYTGLQMSPLNICNSQYH